MSALELQCPECGHYGGHEVEQTQRDPGNLTCIPDNNFPVFMPNYRVRIKRCIKCHKQFGSIEMPEMYFEAIVSEINRLSELEKTRGEDKDKIQSLTNKLKQVAEISNNI
ncbi:hypothetical protein [Citrifermentans bremense]|uniref:Uncharacterized protein n=2 Tax=Citrifermentans bremense TaxID=60035 RepID=A0A6S6LX48_9BACT|nr:hypothetical protein [Citrifermentans bremense]